jgi:hypothetical protein
MQQYEGIVEIEKTWGVWTTNFFLNNGYHLLGIITESYAEQKPEPDRQYFIRRRIVYVMGRTADVARVERPKRQKREEESTDGSGAPDRPAVGTTEGESQDPG